MNEQEEAAWELHGVLTDLEIPYAVIGGLAVGYWGEPRFTQDVDVTVMLPLEEDVEPLLQEVGARLVLRIPDAVDFARRNRVLLARSSNGVSLDIALGLPGYEDEVMARVVGWPIEPGKTLRLASAEDLIVHKLVAGRPRDLRDVEGIVYRQGHGLDANYVRRWVGVFARMMDRPDLGKCFEGAWEKVPGLEQAQ